MSMDQANHFVSLWPVSKLFGSHFKYITSFVSAFIQFYIVEIEEIELNNSYLQ